MACKLGLWWDIPNVQTITIRSKGRAVIPDTREGQVFAYVRDADGTRRLIPVAVKEPAPAQVRFEKRGGFTVGVTDQPISMEAIQEALADFP